MTWDWRRTLRQLSLTDWVVIAAVLIGAFLRLYNFANTLQFLGDQGRDAMVVARIFREQDIMLIGPVTSTGNMYLGPLYYYFMMPFLMLSYPSPIGPAYAVAVLSILTTGLIYVLGQELVGKRAAAIASVMFAVSHLAVLFARFSWNPNPAPLFGLLFVWCAYQTEKKSSWWWVGVSLCIGVLIQLHYVALLTLLAAGVIWLRQVISLRLATWKERRQFASATLVAVAVFVAMLSPLIAFDIRHDYLNIRSLGKFLATSQDSAEVLTTADKVELTLRAMFDRSLQVLFDVSIGKMRAVNSVLLAVVGAALAYLSLRKSTTSHQIKYQAGIRVLSVTLLMSVIGLSFYKSSVFDHYITFILPISFLIFGALFDWISRYKVGMVVTAVCLIFFGVYNVQRLPLKTIGWTIYDMQRTSQTIADRVKPGEKYNIVLLSETKDVYGENYRYFLTTAPNPPLRIEQFGEVETLFIIDEQRLVKDVTSLPIYEIVVFPNKQATEVYDIPGGPQITVLRKQAQ